MRTFAIVLALLSARAMAVQVPAGEMEGITFDSGERVLVPVRELAGVLGWEVHADPKDGSVYLRGRQIPVGGRLYDGTALIAVADLRAWDTKVEWDDITRVARLSVGDKVLDVPVGQKRVVINKSKQELRAYQGSRLVFETRVSTGRKDFETPSGTWTVGPEKSKMRRSSLYEDAPMPWSVQIVGNYFLHGYPSVPKRPASHGCVRLPIRGRNPAKWFWYWVDTKSTVTIGNSW